MYYKLIRFKNSYWDEIHIKIYNDQADQMSTAVAYLSKNVFNFNFFVNSIKTEQSLLYLIDSGLAIINNINQTNIPWQVAHNKCLYYNLSLTTKALLNVL
jgi:hypothetical protein